MGEQPRASPVWPCGDLPLWPLPGIGRGVFRRSFFGRSVALTSAYEGKKLPEFSLDGLTQDGGFASSDLAQGRPVLINVWASWCGPCRDEHPALMQLAALGVPIFGLNYKDNPGAAKRFLGRLGNPYTAVGADTSGRVALDLGVYGVPETFVLDGQARVVYRQVGPLDATSLKTKILPFFTTP